MNSITIPCSDQHTIFWSGVLSFAPLRDFSRFAQISKFHKSLVKPELIKRLTALMQELNEISETNSNRLGDIAIRRLGEKIDRYAKENEINSSRIQKIIILSQIICWDMDVRSLRVPGFLQELKDLPEETSYGDEFAWSHICRPAEGGCLIDEEDGTCLINNEKRNSCKRLINFLGLLSGNEANAMSSKKAVVKLSYSDTDRLSVLVINRETELYLGVGGLEINMYHANRTDKFAYVSGILDQMFARLFPNGEGAVFLYDLAQEKNKSHQSVG